MARPRSTGAARGLVALVSVFMLSAWLAPSALASSTGAKVPPMRGNAHDTQSGLAWLNLVNLYRSASRLAPVTDNPAWDAGLQAHFRYIWKSSGFLTGPYQNLHLENPASPYYTAAGAQEGSSSDLYFGGGWDISEIDGWLTSPFHALGMLNPTLGQVAFAQGVGMAGIDLGSGSGENPPATSPVLFPGPGMATGLTTYSGGEVPSPLQTCHWSDSATVGLPLIAQLTQAPAVGLTASLMTPGGTSENSRRGNLCVVDANDYVTTDPVYGPTGLDLLSADNAVFLIPRAPLVHGTYTASIEQPGQPAISWSFHVVGAPVIRTRAFSRAVIGVPYTRHLVGVGGTRPYSWTLKFGSHLPPGLSFSSAGVISGVPAKAGVFNFQVYMTDALGDENQQYLPYSIVVKR